MVQDDVQAMLNEPDEWRKGTIHWAIIDGQNNRPTARKETHEACSFSIRQKVLAQVSARKQLFDHEGFTKTRHRRVLGYENEWSDEESDKRWEVAYALQKEQGTRKMKDDENRDIAWFKMAPKERAEEGIELRTSEGVEDRNIEETSN